MRWFHFGYKNPIEIGFLISMYNPHCDWYTPSTHHPSTFPMCFPPHWIQKVVNPQRNFPTQYNLFRCVIQITSEVIRCFNRMMNYLIPHTFYYIGCVKPTHIIFTLCGWVNTPHISSVVETKGMNILNCIIIPYYITLYKSK